MLGEGEGLDVSVSNINWWHSGNVCKCPCHSRNIQCKAYRYKPCCGNFGTAALTGVYKAYEDITGEQLDEIAKLAGTQELVVTAELLTRLAAMVRL